MDDVETDKLFGKRVRSQKQTLRAVGLGRERDFARFDFAVGRFDFHEHSLRLLRDAPHGFDFEAAFCRERIGLRRRAFRIFHAARTRR